MSNISIEKTLSRIKELAADVISIKNLPYEWFFYKRTPKIKNVNETIDLLLKGKSIVRFGDGEFYLMKGYSIPFQKNDKKLQERLKQIFKNKMDNLLIGLPETFTTLNQYIPQEEIFWRKYMAINRSFIYKFIDFNENYVSGFFSRPYLRFKNKKMFPEYLKR